MGKKRSRKKKAGFTVIFAIMGTLVGWSFYNILNQGVADFLSYFGIFNFYLQNLIIIGIFGIVLWFAGKKFWKYIVD